MALAAPASALKVSTWSASVMRLPLLDRVVRSPVLTVSLAGSPSRPSFDTAPTSTRQTLTAVLDVKGTSLLMMLSRSLLSPLAPTSMSTWLSPATWPHLPVSVADTLALKPADTTSPTWLAALALATPVL